MRYAAFVEEPPACDYSSVACGKDLWFLDARTLTEAYEEAKELIVGTWNSECLSFEDGNKDIQSVRILVIHESLTFSVKRMWDEAREQVKEAIDKKKESEEKQLYERLKEKYG